MHPTCSQPPTPNPDIEHGSWKMTFGDGDLNLTTWCRVKVKWPAGLYRSGRRRAQTLFIDLTTAPIKDMDNYSLQMSYFKYKSLQSKCMFDKNINKTQGWKSIVKRGGKSVLIPTRPCTRPFIKRLKPKRVVNI